MKVIAKNKKARFNYTIEKTFEAGIVLSGNEIKSIRQGHVSIEESFVKIDYKGNVNVINMFIKRYENAHSVSVIEERASRRLLLHKKEITKIKQSLNEMGFTLVPTKVYYKGNLVKVEIALAKGKKVHDKRQALKEKDIKLHMDKAIKNRF